MQAGESFKSYMKENKQQMDRKMLAFQKWGVFKQSATPFLLLKDEFEKKLEKLVRKMSVLFFVSIFCLLSLKHQHSLK